MRIRTVAALLTLVAAVVALAQVRETVNVNVIEVPVTVVDSSGNPVRGLTAANFQLFDDGKPQTITSFDNIDFAVKQFATADVTADRLAIDVSGDGTNNSGREVGAARDDALAAGITINGLAIINENPSVGAFSQLLPGAAVTLLRFLGQAMEAEGLQIRWNVGTEFSGRLGRIVQHLGHHFPQSRGPVRQPAGQQLRQQGGHGVVGGGGRAQVEHAQGGGQHHLGPRRDNNLWLQTCL